MSKQKTNQKFKPFINLRQDLMFKTFFSKDERLLTSLVETFISRPKGKTIEGLTIKNQEEIKTWMENFKGKLQKQQEQEQQKPSLALGDSAVYPQFPGGKKIVLDLLVHLSTGESINVETQSLRHADFMERTLYYWSKIYGQDFKSGENYDVLKPAYSLIFTDFRLFAHSENFLNSFSIRSDKPPHFVLTDHFGMTMVDLSRFSALSKGKGPKSFIDMISAWCYFINNSSSLTDRDFEYLAKINKIFELAKMILKSLSMDKVTRGLEMQREKAIADHYAFIKDAKVKGMKEGREEGMKEGRQEGLKEGMQKMQQQFALNLLREKADLSFISKMTGLCVEEIKKLK